MRLRLHHRLALPFAAVAVAATAVATTYAVREARQWVSDRRQEDAAGTAQLLQRAEYATNPALLRVAADLTNVEVVTFREDGSLVASSFPSDVPPDVLQRVLGPERPRQTSCGESCFIVYGNVFGTPGMMVAVIAGRGAPDLLTASTVNSIWLAGLVGVTLLIGASELLARFVTARVQRLVDFTHKATADTVLRTEEGRDEIGRLGAAFNAMLDRLEEKQQALMRSEKLAVAGMMAARVAHDVRNPLSSIKMQTQLLHGQMPKGSDEAAGLAAVLRDVNQLDSVVRDLLETARPEEPTLEPVTVAELVRTSAEPLRARLAHRRIELVLRLDGQAPPMPLDPSRIRRALVNVLANAAEATRAGGSITVVTHFDQGEQIIEVADDGVGIDPAIMDRVFDPFVSTKPDGVGLGLVNAKAIVESHGGRITLEPRASHGTLVTIRLPQRSPNG
jgi:signal transduction histidine kinase